MAGLLPLVRGGRACALYPVVRTVEFLTGLRIHMDFSEQRWKRRPPLTRFTLAYSSMTAGETADIRTFFDSQGGSYDSTWDFVLGRALVDGAISGTALSARTDGFSILDLGKDVVIEGAGGGGGPYISKITGFAAGAATVADALSYDAIGHNPIRVGRLYRNMALEHDTLPMTEQESMLYNFTLTARQTANRTFTIAAPGSSYPDIATGLKAQRPYTRIQRYAVLRNDNVYGPRYSWSWIDAGLTGFPAGALHGWQLDYAVLSDAQLAILENFFMGNWGRFGSFSFTDPDNGVTYSDVRFDSDSLEIHHEQSGVSSVSVRLVNNTGTYDAVEPPTSVYLGFSVTTSCLDPTTPVVLIPPSGSWFGAGGGGTSADALVPISTSDPRSYTATFSMGASLSWDSPARPADDAYGTLAGIYLQCTYADGSVKVLTPHSATVVPGNEGSVSASGAGATFEIWRTRGLMDLPGVRFGNFR